MNDFMPVPSEQEWTESDRQWFERVRSLESQVAQLEQDRLKLEGERETIGEHLLTAIQQRDEATTRHIASDESAYQLQAQVSKLEGELLVVEAYEEMARRDFAQLQTQVAQLQTTISQLEAAILRHAEHRVTCTYEHGTCDCGLDELLATITPKPEEGQPKEDKTV